MAQKFLNGIDVSSTTVINGNNLSSDSTVLDVQGSQGQLFSVTNSLTGDLFSVSDISGIPILNVNSSGAITFDGYIPDNNKLKFGNSGDLEIYHDGSNSYIDETGTGSLYIKSAGAIRLQSSAGENMIYAVNDGAVNLYYNNVNRLQTTNTGVSVTGGWVTSGVSVAQANVEHTDNTKALFGNGNDLKIYHDGTDSIIQNYTGSIYIDNNADNQDIVFRCDNGSGGIENYMQIDGSAGRTLFNKNIRVNDNVQIQIGSSADLLLSHNGTNSYLSNYTGDFYIENAHDDGDIIFKSDDGSGGTAEYFRLDGGSTMNVFSKPIWQGDGVKSFFGNSQDLEIYHDGSNSYVKDTGAGSLILVGTDLQLKSAGDEFFMYGAADGQVALYNNGIKKFETTSTGVEVTGNGTFSGDVLVEDNLYLTDAGTVRGKIQLNSSDRDNLDIKAVSLGSLMRFYTVDTLALTLDDSQDATFAGDVTVGGDLIVNGTTTTLNTTTVEVEDNILQLNTTQGSPDTATAATSGISVYRGVDGSGNAITQASLIFDDGDDTWDLTNNLKVEGNTTFEGDVAIQQTGDVYLTLESTDATTPEEVAVKYSNSATGIYNWWEGLNQSASWSLGYGESFSGSNTKLLVNTSGNVGIGTTSPDHKLEVQGVISSADSGLQKATFANVGNDLVLTANAGQTNVTAKILFNSSGSGGGAVSTKMIIDGAGNVGIGTTSPSEKLDVNGNVKIKDALLLNQENTDIDSAAAEVVAQVAHATYTAAFFDFVVKKGTNVRSGTVYACHNGDSTPLVEFTETSTNDLGDTSDVTLSVDISGANMRLLATVASDNWSVKTLIRAI